MDQEYRLIFETTDLSIIKIKNIVKPYSKEEIIKHSSGGIEIFELILGIFELIIIIVEYPIIVDFIRKKQIIVKFGKFVVNDNLNKILKYISKDQNVLNEIKSAYQDRSICIEGAATSVIEFEQKLQKLFEKVKVDENE